jgi:hypothetical protein
MSYRIFNRTLCQRAQSRDLSKDSLNLKRAENCPNFSFFLFGPGYFNYDYRTLCQRAREIFFCRRQAPHGLRGTTAREIYPTLCYFNYGPGKLPQGLWPEKL